MEKKPCQCMNANYMLISMFYFFQLTFLRRNFFFVLCWCKKKYFGNIFIDLHVKLGNNETKKKRNCIQSHCRNRQKGKANKFWKAIINIQLKRPGTCLVNSRKKTLNFYLISIDFNYYSVKDITLRSIKNYIRQFEYISISIIIIRFHFTIIVFLTAESPTIL